MGETGPRFTSTYSFGEPGQRSVSGAHATATSRFTNGDLPGFRDRGPIRRPVGTWQTAMGLDVY